MSEKQKWEFIKGVKKSEISEKGLNSEELRQLEILEKAVGSLRDDTLEALRDVLKDLIIQDVATALEMISKGLDPRDSFRGYYEFDDDKKMGYLHIKTLGSRGTNHARFFVENTMKYPVEVRNTTFPRFKRESLEKVLRRFREVERDG